MFLNPQNTLRKYVDCMRKTASNAKNKEVWSGTPKGFNSFFPKICDSS